MLAASFFFSEPRHPSLVLPIAAAMAFVLGLFLERMRATRIKADTSTAGTK